MEPKYTNPKNVVLLSEKLINETTNIKIIIS